MMQQFLSYTYYLLLAVLIFNLTQRKHQDHGERKRLASLFTAGGILLFLTFMQAVVHFDLGPWGYTAATALTALYYWFLRKKIAVFRFSCPECGSRYSWNNIFYYDTPTCSCTTKIPAVPDSVDDVDWDTWKAKEEAVLCFIVRDGQVLLINKKTGLGAGKVSAPGGRIEAGETPEEAAIRETIEETGLTPYNLEERTELCFIFADGYSLHGRAFFATDCSGDMIETDEADPFWCSVEEIPFDKMWADDPLWIPGAMEGEKKKGVFIFDGDTMLSHRFEMKS